MFSADGTGRTWSNHTRIFDYGDMSAYGGEKQVKGPGSYGYTGIREVAPGRILFVWDVDGWDGPEGMGNYVRGAFIEVTTK